jgi:hypothetical protein
VAQLSLPTSPDKSIAIPAGLAANERGVLELLNRAGTTFAAAVRGPDVRPLSEIYTGRALEVWTAYVNTLLFRGEYDANELQSISLIEFRLEGPNDAFARTREQWTSARHESASRRRLSSLDILQEVEYHIVRIDSRWLIRDGNLTVINQTQN